ncbi:MAG: hypothetical protein KAZ30_03195 [Candidatus Magasanikbacteria bacterium]|nr:hypothetical protein [Candidatus Magasanikbacteria bacterium]
MPVTSSQDILYIVLSLCILWFTVFLCWLLYQAGRVLRNANKVVEGLMQQLELISSAVDFIRKKVDGLSSSMGVVSSLATGLVEKYIVGKFAQKTKDTDERERVKKKKR